MEILHIHFEVHAKIFSLLFIDYLKKSWSYTYFSIFFIYDN